MIVSLFGGQTYSISPLGKPEICIILPEKDPILRPGSKHPVWLIYSFCDEVINQDSDVRFVATQDKRLLLLDFQSCVNAGHQPLCRSFFVPCGAVDLPGKIQIRDVLQLERNIQLRRVEVIIFNGISRLEDLCIFQTFDGMKRIQLGLERKGRGESLKIVFGSIPALRLEEQLVGILIFENPELVLDARTISRPLAGNLSGKKRGFIETGTEDIVNLLVGMKDIARHLFS